MAHLPTIESDLLIIGRGLAGSTAALFAAQKGLRVTHLGRGGDITFGSGLLDLMGYHPLKEGRVRTNPWAAIGALLNDEPNHPYRLTGRTEIESAFDTLLDFLKSQGLPYHRNRDTNSLILTPLGTFKPTFALPESMLAGVRAMAAGQPALIVGFKSMADFSAGQIAGGAGQLWPNIRSITIDYPEKARNHLSTGDLAALGLEIPDNQETLARALKDHIGDAGAIGFPAILGLDFHSQVVASLEEKLGLPVFEIPILPVSVPGMRLAKAFKRGLAGLGVEQYYQHEVIAVESMNDNGFALTVAHGDNTTTFTANEIILAGGRLVGHGLFTDRNRIRESIFDLAVHQPSSRDQWHSLDFLDRAGHRINRAGIEVDEDFRALDPSGRPHHRNLRAIGSILAHQDWMRMGCGGGLAVATAYGAVKGLKSLQPGKAQTTTMAKKRVDDDGVQAVAVPNP